MDTRRTQSFRQGSRLKIRDARRCDVRVERLTDQLEETDLRPVEVFGCFNQPRFCGINTFLGLLPVGNGNRAAGLTFLQITENLAMICEVLVGILDNFQEPPGFKIFPNHVQGDGFRPLVNAVRRSIDTRCLALPLGTAVEPVEDPLRYCTACFAPVASVI